MNRDGRDTPLKVITTAANVNDVTQTLARIDGIPPVAGRPGRPRRRPVSLLGDKVYDSHPHRRELRKRRILPVIWPTHDRATSSSRSQGVAAQGLARLASYWSDSEAVLRRKLTFHTGQRHVLPHSLGAEPLIRLRMYHYLRRALRPTSVHSATVRHGVRAGHRGRR
ncbi:transposase [Streptomyces flavofungini]|uniref:transposase n=1 Tax=Streptomyces flavofungini TaxID=68200 RepID=UPI0034DF2D4D